MIKVSTNKKFLYIYPAPKEDKGTIIIFLEDRKPVQTEVLKGKVKYIIPKELRGIVRGVSLS
jgi:hypothetical protein